jgi:hypothetical protein
MFLNSCRAVQCYCTRLIDNGQHGSTKSPKTQIAFTGYVMDAPASVTSAEKPIESDMAEDICKLLEQSILKYFPQVENDVDRPKASSVPLIPHRQDKPST